MRVFESENVRAWEGKVNFVDHNNVVLGFDNSQYCCECFGWFFSWELPKNIDYKGTWKPDNLESFVFDPHSWQR